MRVALLPVPSFHTAVNHLLRRESWARAQLLPYAGRRARLHAQPVTFDVCIAADGLLALPSTARDAAVEGPADVEITVLPDAMPALLRYGPSVLMKHVRIEGDAEFAQALGRLAEHLRWEPEEDLARWIGDASAHRVVQGARQLGTQLRRLAESAAGQVAEYLLDEQPQLVRTRIHAGFGAEIAATAQQVQSLEARIARLEQQRAGSGRPAVLPSSIKHTGAPR